MNKKYDFDGDVKIIPPVFIGDKVKIENSVIGPYATINDNCHIKNSKIKDSIINAHTTITDSSLQDSLVGEHCKIHNQSKKLYLGEYSEI
jgi:glucose-1-phosphate thymidylyltransferase